MKVRRLISDCCGMKKDQIYEAEETFGGAYLKCKLPDGTWTNDHWSDRESDDPWFEIVLDGGEDE